MVLEVEVPTHIAEVGGKKDPEQKVFCISVANNEGQITCAREGK